MAKKKITNYIVPREGLKGTGLVKMDYDHPEKDAIKVRKPRKEAEFKPAVGYELVPDQKGGFVERPRVEFPDLKPVVGSKDVATTKEVNKEQVQRFMKDFIEARNPKGDPYTKRNPADFSPPKIEVGGNDGIHVWLEVYKYGRQTTERVCKHMGAYTAEYTLSIITLLVNAAYLFLYKDGTVDCIPDTIRDKIIPPPPKEKQPEKPSAEGLPPEIAGNPKVRVIELVEEEDYNAEKAVDKHEKKKYIIKSKTTKEKKDEEDFGIEDSDDSHKSD